MIILSVLLCLWLGIEAESGPIGDPSGFVSVVWKEGQWKVIPDLLDWDEDHSIVARANFTNAQNTTGWMMLEVQTREDVPDQLQAQAAGIAEGYLTRISITESYNEFYTNDVCAKDPDLCDWITDTFITNEALVGGKIAQLAQTDPYWHQVNLYYIQMSGMSQGWRLKSLRDPRPEDAAMDNTTGIMHLNFAADFWDLVEQYKLLNQSGEIKLQPSRPSCTVVIKYLDEKKDILFGHNTWHEYRAMSSRILKNYNLNFHVLPGSADVIPGHTISMSSYAGSLVSLDDFYLTSAGLATTETTLFVYNKELLKSLTPENAVYEPIRVAVANRLAEFGSQWAKIFEKHNSGTYNNQWMIVDYKMLEMPEIPTEGVLTVLEQLPGIIIIDDQTKVLLDRTYWKSYNRAFYNETFQLSGAPELVSKYGDWFTYDKTPRSKIIDRDHAKIQDLDSFMDFMRYNDFKNDPLAQVEGCDPLSNPAGSIANRLDLSDPGMKCSFSEHDHMVGHWGYGALDAKLASKDSFPLLNFLAVAGPTHDLHPPFSWSLTNIPDKKPTFLPIDTFDFEPFNHTWVMNQGQANGLSNLVVALMLSIWFYY